VQGARRGWAAAAAVLLRATRRGRERMSH
jgi:hypothetical protein